MNAVVGNSGLQPTLYGLPAKWKMLFARFINRPVEVRLRLAGSSSSLLGYEIQAVADGTNNTNMISVKCLRSWERGDDHLHCVAPGGGRRTVEHFCSAAVQPSTCCCCCSKAAATRVCTRAAMHLLVPRSTQNLRCLRSQSTGCDRLSMPVHRNCTQSFCVGFFVAASPRTLIISVSSISYCVLKKVGKLLNFLKFLFCIHDQFVREMRRARAMSWNLSCAPLLATVFTSKISFNDKPQMLPWVCFVWHLPFCINNCLMCLIERLNLEKVLFCVRGRKSWKRKEGLRKVIAFLSCTPIAKSTLRNCMCLSTATWLFADEWHVPQPMAQRVLGACWLVRLWRTFMTTTVGECFQVCAETVMILTLSEKTLCAKVGPLQQNFPLQEIFTQSCLFIIIIIGR